MLDEFCLDLPVSVSPDGHYLLRKQKRPEGFKITVEEIRSQIAIAVHFSRETQLLLSWSPDSTRIAFVMATDNGTFSLWIWNVQGGEVPVSAGIHGMERAIRELAWSPDGEFLTFEKSRHIYALNVQTQEMRRAIAIASARSGHAWSPNGLALVGVSEICPDAITLWSLRGSQRHAIPGAKTISDCSWTPDGTGVVVAAVTAMGDSFLWSGIPGESGALVLKTAGEIGRIFHYEGSLCWHETRDGVTRLESVNSQCVCRHEGAEVRERYLCSGGWVAVKSWSRPVRFCASGDEEGGVPLEARGGKNIDQPPHAVKLTVLPDREAPGFYWRPRSPQGGVILCEGGPGLHITPSWDPLIAALVSRNAAVLALNYGGSSGYGHAWQQQDWGAELDVEAGIAFLRSQGLSKITLVGRSRGCLGILAARSGDLPRVICSLPMKPSSRSPGRGPVIGFHGRRDPQMSPDAAREALIETVDEVSNWVELVEEGHHFQRPISQCRMAEAILNFFANPGADFNSCAS